VSAHVLPLAKHELTQISNTFVATVAGSNDAMQLIWRTRARELGRRSLRNIGGQHHDECCVLAIPSHFRAIIVGRR
jgi:hypothetical protein